MRHGYAASSEPMKENTRTPWQLLSNSFIVILLILCFYMHVPHINGAVYV